MIKLIFLCIDDIMAMARPNTTAIKKHKMVDQFQQLGLKSIINLQTPGIYIFDGRSPSSLHVLS